MQILVHLRDQQGTAHEHELEVSLPRFLKSAAMVGRGGVSLPRTFFRAAGALLHYREYFDLGWPFHFVRPRGWDYDPTTMGDFSTLAGRAIADICARQFSGAITTHGYEAAMLAQRFPVIGRRPDLYCDTGRQQFAVESKATGDESVSDAAMNLHKQQATSGPLPVHFAVACVTYRLYHGPEVNYYDPVLPDTPYDGGLNTFLARNFYARVLDVTETLPRYPDREIEGVTMLRYALQVEDRVSVRLLIDRKVLDWAIRDVNQPPPFREPQRRPFYDGRRTFVDADGIGIEVAESDSAS